MVLDPSTISAQPNIRTERPEPINTGVEQTNRARPERPEAGQTSEVSPDVVNNVSAAALEASRAATQAPQPADDTPTEDAVRASERRVEQRPPEPPPEPPEQDRGRIDVVV